MITIGMRGERDTTMLPEGSSIQENVELLRQIITDQQKIIKEKEFYNLIIDNPESLDYQQNREYYRILAEYDCIYTVETSDGMESFNAVTYDISAGGVSIITTENIVPTRETSLVIFMPNKDLKTHLQFVRCEALENDEYKLSFIFTDLSDSDFEMLSELCVKKQLSQF